LKEITKVPNRNLSLQYFSLILYYEKSAVPQGVKYSNHYVPINNDTFVNLEA